MMDDFAQRFLEGLQIGQSERQRQQQLQMELERHEWAIQEAKDLMEWRKIQKRQLERQAALENYNLLSGTPAPGGVTPEAAQGVLGGDLFMFQQGAAPQRHAPITIPPLMEGGQTLSVQPPTQEEALQQRYNQLLMEQQVKNPSYSVEIPGMGRTSLPENALPAFMQSYMQWLTAQEGREAEAAEKEAERKKDIEVAQIGAEGRVKAAGISASKQGRNEKFIQDQLNHRERMRVLADYNTRMAQANQGQWEPVNRLPWEPPTELEVLRQTKQGPGVRREGYGRMMPIWLAQQYLRQAGDMKTAIRWAMNDGWIIDVEE